jgi:hypothetical protein
VLRESHRPFEARGRNLEVVPRADAAITLEESLKVAAHAGAVVGGDTVTRAAVRTVNPNLDGRAPQRTRLAEVDEFESLIRDTAAHTLEERDGSHQDGAKKNVGELPHILTRLLELP